MKYIGRNALNELKRRGVKVPKPLKYEEVVKRIRAAESNIKSGDSDILTIERTPNYKAMLAAKDKAEQRKFLKYVTDMYDIHKLSFREIVISMNKTTYNENTSDPERQLKIVKDLVRKGTNYIKNETRYSPAKTPKTLKGLRTTSTHIGKQISSKAPLSIGVHKGRLLKSLEHYPHPYKKLILAQIERLGDGWLLETMNKNLPLLDLVLSSDGEIIANAGEFAIQDYFELDYGLKIDEEIRFHTVNLTGKQFNELIETYIF